MYRNIWTYRYITSAKREKEIYKERDREENIYREREKKKERMRQRE